MSNITEIISENLDTRTLAPKAVGSQVALMSAVSLITILVFNLLRPQNKVVYEPKVKYHEGDKAPPRISSSVFGWVGPLIHVKEPELVDKIGLDAVAFLRFLRMMRWVFTAIAVATCVVLLPINITVSLRRKNTKNDILSIMTIRDVDGYYLFAHVAMAYVITFIVFAGVWYHWKQMVRLRRDFFRSPEYTQSFYARTLAVTEVPKKFQSDEGIRQLFESTQAPYPTTSVHIGRRVGILPELIEAHNDTVRKFEQVLVHYLKGGKIRKERPTIRVGGFLGIGGKKYDAIDYYTEKLKMTEQRVEAYREQMDRRKPENYGFASMAAVPYAHIVAQILRRKRAKGAVIALAPNPKDIIWENMNRSRGELARKKTLGWVWLITFCFLNTIPLFVVSIAANLTSISSFIPFLQSWQNNSRDSFDFVSGVLPPAISALFGFFLPRVMRWLSKYQGSMTHSRLDRAVVARYFAFLVISQLIIFTLIGVVFNSVASIITEVGEHESFQQILDNLHTLPRFINSTYIDQSSYWLTFFPLRGFLVVFDLAQIVNLVFISFKTHILGRTPRDYREFTRPQDFEYAVYYSNILFMGAIGLTFAPLAPLVVVAAACVFWICSWVYKYQLMFVFVSHVETGGRMWNPVINRLLFSLMLMHLLMVLTIGLQYGWMSFAWVATIPPFFMVLIFKSVINRTFHRPFRYYVPTEEELRAAKIHSDRADAKGNRLEKRFGHPALHAELFTPMLHANMMPLLADIYHGKLQHEQTKVQEYGGQQLDSQIVPGGLRIAAVEQRDLEYDPMLYRRDRGELDWDQRSMASTAMLLNSDAASMYPPSTKAHFDRQAYLAHGLQGSEIELSQMYQSDKLPLLPGANFTSPSNASLPAYPPSRIGTPVARMEPDELPPVAAQYASPVGQYNNNNPQYGSSDYPYPPGVYTPPQAQYGREAPMHRPTRQDSSWSASGYHASSPSVSQPHQQLPSPQQGRQSPGPQAAYGYNQHQQTGSVSMAMGRQSPGPQAMMGRQSPGPQAAYGRQSPGPQMSYAGSAEGGGSAEGNMAGRGARMAYRP